MNIQEAYNKFKHLDDLLSDRRWLKGEDLASYVLYELWQAVKDEVENQPELSEGNQEIADIAFRYEVEHGTWGE